MTYIYVDPDAGGANNGTSWGDAYTTMDAALKQLGGTSLSDDYTITYRASLGTADTTQADFDGLVTMNGHTITISAASGDEALKTGWDATRYRLDVTDPGTTGALYLNHGYGDITVDGLQLKATYSSTNFNISLNINSVAASMPAYTIKNCRIQNTDVNGAGEGIKVQDADATVVIQNTIVEDCDWHLVAITVAATVSMYNCILARQDYSTGSGLYINNAGATVVMKNCAIFDTRDDVYNNGASPTIQYNLADDDLDTEFSESSNVQPSGGDIYAEYLDPDNGDYSVLNTGSAYDNGVGPGTDANVPTTDIDGDTRSGATCDIGIDEYVAAGGGISIPVVMLQHDHLSGGAW